MREILLSLLVLCIVLLRASQPAISQENSNAQASASFAASQETAQLIQARVEATIQNAKGRVRQFGEVKLGLSDFLDLDDALPLGADYDTDYQPLPQAGISASILILRDQGIAQPDPIQGLNDLQLAVLRQNWSTYWTLEPRGGLLHRIK